MERTETRVDALRAVQEGRVEAPLFFFGFEIRLPGMDEDYVVSPCRYDTALRELWSADYLRLRGLMSRLELTDQGRELWREWST